MEELTRQNALDVYAKKFTLGEKRLFGRESELPLVYISKDWFGEAARFPDVESVFARLAEDGFTPNVDPSTKHIVGVTGNVAGYDVTVTTDFGACTLEVAFAPTSSLQESAMQTNAVMGMLADYFLAKDIAILGYGIQPLTAPDRSLLPIKGRAATLESRFYTQERLNGHNTDVHFHTINASEQIHVDVSAAEAIPVLNALTKITPYLHALFANSAVWKGHPDELYLEPREKFWDWVVNIPQDTFRKGLPHFFSSLDMYLATILEFEPVMTVRTVEGTNQYLEFFGTRSFREYLEKGRSQVIVPGSKKNPKLVAGVGEEISPAVLDLLVHESFVWFANRLKSVYGTIELRSFAQQPFDAAHAPEALVRGLLHNKEEFLSYVRSLPGMTVLKLRKDREAILREGFGARIDQLNMPAHLGELLRIAEDGLRRGGEDPAYLDPLQQRLRDRTNPSTQAKQLWEQGGIEKIIKERALHEHLRRGR
ncbi:MAG: hypothetical protein H6502_01685 [Candidatus Woesearchaeota archaeon]|nr:MAG: hypothetical protein H6502_01685 [Candidatus Woesearchaeota archaeon]